MIVIMKFFKKLEIVKRSPTPSTPKTVIVFDESAVGRVKVPLEAKA